MPYIEVDIDLDEIETKDLIDELILRIKTWRRRNKLTDKDKKELKEQLGEMLLHLGEPIPKSIEIKTLDDKMKLQFLIEVWNKFSVPEFERRLSA